MVFPETSACGQGFLFWLAKINSCYFTNTLWVIIFSSHLCVCALGRLQSCLTLYDPVDCSPPGSSVHGISQARILEWAAMTSSRGSLLTQGLNLCLLCLRHRQVDSLSLCHLRSHTCKVVSSTMSFIFTFHFRIHH